MSSTTAKQRKTAVALGDSSSLQQRQQHLKQQRQTNLKTYSETIRKETRHTKQSLVLKLIILPMLVIVLGTVSMSLKFIRSSSNSNNTSSNNNVERKKEVVDTAGNGNSPGANGQPPTNTDPLPRWITDYVQWHQEMRKKFPGDDLFTNPDAPKLLVRTCMGICGGLHDRVGQLPWDIYLAMRLNRVLLIAWQRPRSLENFMLPPPNNNDNQLSIDWTIPDSQKFGFDDIKRVRSEVRELFDGNNVEANPGAGDFWQVGFERSMVRAGAPPSPGVSSEFQKDTELSETKILRHRLLGHLDENLLEERLVREGYYNDQNDKASDLHKAPTFGAVWNLFFRPSPAVRTEIVEAMKAMGLLLPSTKDASNKENANAPLPPTVDYNAAHCRVRHPKAHPPGEVVKGKWDRYPADKTGLPWIEGGPQRAFALETANKALVCAHEAETNERTTKGEPLSAAATTTSPVYFLSDSNDLVKHVAVELSDETYLREHGKNSSWVYPPLLETVRSQNVVARNTTLENAHIDRQKGREAPAYYATFVDLFITMHAKCVVYGIGYYAAFAAKVSGTPCAYLYAKEAWGGQVEKNAHICPNTDTA